MRKKAIVTGLCNIGRKEVGKGEERKEKREGRKEGRQGKEKHKKCMGSHWGSNPGR